MDQWIREQFKSKGGFGTATLESRRSALHTNRKEHRNILLNKFRNIPENTLSPLMTPNVSQVKKVQGKSTIASQSGVTGNNKRMELLKKWREEREKKKLESKKKAKPPFKVFHVDQTDKLDDVYKTIKGKPIISRGNVPMKLHPQKEMNESKCKTNLESVSSNLQNKLTEKASEKTKDFKQKNAPNRTNPSSEVRFKSAKQQKEVKKCETISSKFRMEQRKKENLKNSKTNSRMSGKAIKTTNEKIQPSAQKISEGKCLEINSTIKSKSQQSTDDLNCSLSEVPRKITRSQKKTMSVKTDNTEELISKKRSTRKSISELPVENGSASKNSLIEGRKINMDHEDGQTKEDDDSQCGKKKIRTRRSVTQNALDSNINNTSADLQIQQKTPRRSSRRTRRKTTEEESISSAKLRKKERTDESSLKSTPVKSKKPIEHNSDLNEDSVTNTPSKGPEEICYISPFVTVSRGKVAARREFEKRKSLNGSVLNTSMSGTSDPRSPKAAAVYFTRQLENEIKRIQNLCEKWQNYKDEADLSEDACGLIDMTIGQSNLLITKKFNQFRGLIEKCQTNDELDMRIKCEDLHGFWDMMYKQVSDLDKRFQNLEDMKMNNWLEKEPKIKTPKIAAKEKKKSGPKKVLKASSTLKETILAARKNRMKTLKSDSDVEILIASKKNTPSRRSKNKEQNEISTPARGILKSSSVKSEKRKTVVFQNVRDSTGGDNDSLSSSRVIKGTPLPSRKSERLSLNKSKLVFD
ncbi:disks large-associated protein 5 isoform X2 [Coccinella septempunctata]|uniref:disks large-associated protein 5 isoform X2 n=1 Tax=Coccinella septempunctata TaxID=41139 RepID=UPI001D07B4E6|nr:disks large-associated protein 5 isoform X2 [Coccinella septempunctata]